MGSMRKTNDCQKTTGIAVHRQEKNVMSLGDVTALLRSPALTFLTVGGSYSQRCPDGQVWIQIQAVNNKHVVCCLDGV